MKRELIKPRPVLLRTEQNRDAAAAILENLPLDPDRPIEVMFREQVKVRTLDANARMWVGPLADISNQGWLRGQQFSPEGWHEMFKYMFLPEENDPDLATLVKDPEKYRKWAHTPTGDRICIGTTTGLTPRGFALYVQQIEAFGAAELGVQFHEAPGRYREAA